MNYEEYFSYDALGLAELVRTKKISQSELLEIALNLTDILDPELNACLLYTSPSPRDS